MADKSKEESEGRPLPDNIYICRECGEEFTPDSIFQLFCNDCAEDIRAEIKEE